jgi:hypothetical protein
MDGFLRDFIEIEIIKYKNLVLLYDSQFQKFLGKLKIRRFGLFWVWRFLQMVRFNWPL